jgi:sarcosine oxidase
MPADYDIIVLGCGTMGAAACLELARVGRRVLGLDRFAPPHEMGEHHGRVRMFRTTYYEHPAYVPWLRRSLRGWQELGKGPGPPLLELTSALYTGPYEGELIAGCLRAAREHALAHAVLDHRELRRRYPMFRVPETYVGLLERDAGFIWCERAVGAMLEAAGREARAPTVRTFEPAISWTASPGHVEVRTAKGTYRASKLVITAGPWSGEVLTGLGVELSATRQVQAWVMPVDPAPYSPGRFPCWGVDVGDGSLFYGFPALAPEGELKLARHAHGPVANPSVADREPELDELDDPSSLVRRFLPDLGEAPMRAGICLYTNSPDSHFIIDRHPEHSNVVFATGFSGHGFKFAPAVGQIIRELVEAEPPSHPEPFFALSRLVGGGGGR